MLSYSNSGCLWLCLKFKTMPKTTLTNQELVALFSGAETTIYPSLDEGFGLTILQAMACGSSVVTSSISSMPETAGDAAVLVYPKSVNDIARGIVKAIKDKETLIAKGLKRSKQYSWEKVARETLKVYEGVRSK